MLGNAEFPRRPRRAAAGTSSGIVTAGRRRSSSVTVMDAQTVELCAAVTDRRAGAAYPPRCDGCHVSSCRLGAQPTQQGTSTSLAISEARSLHALRARDANSLRLDQPAIASQLEQEGANAGMSLPGPTVELPTAFRSAARARLRGHGEWRDTGRLGLRP